jgi:RNA polymerase sigma-70 factor (ECF subfamily)
MAVQPSAALVTRARNGDPEAWRALYAQIGGRLIVWLRSQPHNDPSLDENDVANETWFTAANRIADFHGDDDAFAGWLFGIARNHLLNTNRRCYRRATVPTSLDPRVLLPRHERDLHDREAESDQLAWIRSVLAQLPPREAEVVACLDVVGLDVAGTARALSMSANAVRVSHHRALRRLRTVLAVPAPDASDATDVAVPSRPSLGSVAPIRPVP